MHAETYSTYHRASLAAVCDVDETRARKAADRWRPGYVSQASYVISKAGVLGYLWHQSGWTGVFSPNLSITR